MARVLVVANETVGADELLRTLHSLDGSEPSIYRVVVPAHPLNHGARDVWTQAGAQEAARDRLATTLAVLAREGLDADGVIGDLDPVAATRDALMDFVADVIVVSTYPVGSSRWLRKNVVDKLRRFGLPVVHVVAEDVGAAERMAMPRAVV